MNRNRNAVMIAGLFIVIIAGGLLLASSATAPFSQTLNSLQGGNGGAGGSGGAPQPGVAAGESADGIVIAATPAAESAMMLMPTATAGGSGRQAGGGENQPAQTDVQRVILRNAALTIVVADPAAVIDSIMTLANEMGGWVVSSNATQREDSAGNTVTSGTVVVRVPAARLDEALMQIRSGALEVRNENITGQDVTAEYVDLSSRLTNLRAAEARLLEIMGSAQRTEDVLAVERELTRVRGEIETIEGRLRYFDEAAAYSSVTVTVLPPTPDVVQVQSAGWSAGGTVERALGTLLGLVQGLIDLGINLLIVIGPFALPTLLVALVVWRRRRGRTPQSAA